MSALHQLKPSSDGELTTLEEYSATLEELRVQLRAAVLNMGVPNTLVDMSVLEETPATEKVVVAGEALQATRGVDVATQEQAEVAECRATVVENAASQVSALKTLARSGGS
jgi:hypothetical protein